MNINSNNSEMQLNSTLKDLNIDSEVPKINISTKNNIDMQTKSDIKFNISNIVKIKPILEDLEITPNTEQQIFKSEKDGFDNVTVKAVDSSIDANIQANNIKLGINILGIEGNVIELNGETKYITPSKEEQIIYPSENKNAITEAIVLPIETEELVVTPNKETQIFDHYLYDKVDVKPIPEEYIIPESTIDITENGVYDVNNYKEANVNVPTGSKYPIIEGEGQHEVRFVDYDGTLLKVQYVNTGESATAPKLPNHERLTFIQWNRDYDNITHDLDVGALYRPTSGNTELFINVTEETGLEITLNIYRAVSSGTIRVDWGDGQISTFATGTGAKALTHTYSSYGEYMISIITTVNYRLGGATSSTITVMGSNEDRKYGALIKCYCSEYMIYLSTYCCYNCYNLEEFTMIGATYTGQYSFCNTKQKAVIIPNTTTTIANRIATYCNDLEYLILSDKPTVVSGPLTIGTKIKKCIYPKNYKPTSMTYIVFNDNIEKIWYAKSSTTYAISSAFAQHSSNFKELPIYDNLTGITTTSAFHSSGIKKIKLPPTVTTIANQAFYNCGNLTDIYCYAHTPPTLSGTAVFTSTNILLRVHVYPEDLEAYQTATNWSTSTIKSKLVGDLEGEFTDGYCE